MRKTLVLLLILLLSQSVIGSDVSRSLLSDRSRRRIQSSLLPPKPPPSVKDVDIGLVAALDGTVYMVDTVSGKIRWSFSSGSPIYSSSQANFSSLELSNDFYYVDCGDDWELYVHSKRHGKLQKPSVNAEDYIKMTPHISDNGEVTLGSRKTTVFLVDAKTGTVISSYGFDNYTSVVPIHAGDENAILSAKDTEDLVGSANSNLKLFQHLVYIRRTDYEFMHKTEKGEVLWEVRLANIDAEFRCSRVDSSFDAVPMNVDEDTDAKEWQFPCPMKTSVLRIRDKNMVEFGKLVSAFFGTGPKFLPGDLALEPPSSFPSIEVQTPTSRPPLALPYTEDKSMLELSDSEAENTGLIVPYSKNSSMTDITNLSPDTLTKRLWSVMAILLPTMSLVVYKLLRIGKSGKLPADKVKIQPEMPKKKKSRKSGNKQNVNTEKGVSLGYNDPNGLDGNEGRLIYGHVEGRKIGKLLVSNKEIAKGSNGTVVFEGKYDGRIVAVKRLVQIHHDVASKEIQNLIVSDHHPNIVRWYGVEKDLDFVYLALEHCSCNLSDLVSVYAQKNVDSTALSENAVQLWSMIERNRSFELLKSNGYPSEELLNLMRDVVSGLAHLHELGIIHRDLKPQNVLIINKKSLLCAKISDMGISKRLLEDKTSLTHNVTGHGSSGWQAPEQLLHVRQTRAVDLFSLGCVLFFCMTGGKHPFGDSFERDANIVKGNKDLFLVESVPEAVDLFSRLLDVNPVNRPKTHEVLIHPFFWTPEKRLSFLQEVSDRVEMEDREQKSEILDALESTATVALNGKWDEKMEAAFINNIGRYRRYRYDSIRDLLRVIRNKSHHYRELPQEIQELLGSHPKGFENYFSSRFPKLLMEVYNVVVKYCAEEEFFQKYCSSSTF